MLGKTSISAIRALLLLAQKGGDEYWPPRRIAEDLGESPTYMAKVVRHMVKSGILEAERGAKGGVRLIRQPKEITVLSIVEACQGAIAGSYCKSSRPQHSFCNFHLAALELREAITGVLRRWTLAALLEKTHADSTRGDRVQCLMKGEMNPFHPLMALTNPRPARLRRNT